MSDRSRRQPTLSRWRRTGAILRLFASANLLTLQKALSFFLAELKEISFEETGNLQVDALLEELREFIYSEPFQIPTNYTFLGRAIGTLSGLAAGLDPDMNILAMLKPYARQILGQDISPWQLAWQKTKTLGQASLDVPLLLDKALKDLRSGDIQVRTELGPVLRRLRFQQVLANRLMWSIFIAADGVMAALF